ncbi:MAG: gamma-glutamylcyclotransferase [Devosiaceae bacterium]|nr:gamma-glutamylcyclotransferase [Devosiaceae bacterium MH13]
MTEPARTALHRLATYGSLAPGRENAHQLDGLTGSWTTGTVRGRLVQAGWGAWIGYPGFIPDPQGEAVEAFIFESADLPDHWDRLDAFEGEAYQRIAIPATLEDGSVVEVSLYRVLDEKA